MYVRVCVYIYIYIYAYTHLYTSIHIIIQMCIDTRVPQTSISGTETGMRKWVARKADGKLT